MARNAMKFVPENVRAAASNLDISGSGSPLMPPDRILSFSQVPDQWTSYDSDRYDGESYYDFRIDFGIPVAKLQPGKVYSFGSFQVSQGYRKGYAGPAVKTGTTDHDVWKSAVAMLKEHDMRIADAGAVPVSVTTESFTSLEDKLGADLQKAEDLRVAIFEALEGDRLEEAEAMQAELDAVMSRRKKIEETLYNLSLKEAARYRSDRAALFWSYFYVSAVQFAADRQSLANREPYRRFYSIDHIAPFSPEMLKQKEFEHYMLGQIENDRRTIKELIAAGRTRREIVELSRRTSTDPVARAFVEGLIDAEIPPAVGPVTNPTSPGAPTGTSWAEELEFAPDQTLIGANDPSLAILRDPSLPATPDNILSGEELRQRELRIAQRIVDDAPEYYDLEWEKYKNPARWRQDYVYWRKFYPTAFIDPNENTHIPANAINRPWNPDDGDAPLINLRIVPRTKPLPKEGFLQKYDWLGTVISIVLAVIPVVGPVLSVGVSLILSKVQQDQVASWARDVGEMPPTVFAPQYFPQPFTVPFPLDRAQRVIREPWTIPAAVNKFVQEYSQLQVEAYEDEYERLAGSEVGDAANPEGGTTNPSSPIRTTTPVAIDSRTGQIISGGPKSAGASGGSLKGVAVLAVVGVGVMLWNRFGKKR